ncbi:MAG: restriction endonuclease subunit R [Candidatus Goldiibacteriota bacterium HGW-Goldbacteria-1]|jgi:type I restriction enzyme R subunit|nr:MAG: restriction endonuclease subunit R [Candidatus Goldiibacteriota bacterium HGW-Goldbacteria-1]
MSKTNEQGFEESIEQSLLTTGGYVKGNPVDFDRNIAMATGELFTFIKSTQPKEWAELGKIHGADIEKKFLYRLNQEIDTRGILDCLRNGITDFGQKFMLAYFKPVSGLNPDTILLYNKNILSVTRQVHFSLKDESSLDMVLFLNGLPIVTMELKNQFTGQNVNNAKSQYKYDRDEQEPIFQFKKRTLVHFAVDTDEVAMTTRLQGSKTKYLPFNKGYDKGAGNPPNPNGHRTSYLWEEVLTKDSLMEIIGQFLHLEVKEIETDGKKYKKESMIFPRYHQLDVVRSITSDVIINGAGNNYLIQHSAGSGKSNSIAWLAYRLAGIHDKTEKRVYDSIIVITDRLVLDQQLQNTIYQFEHKAGVVQKIDENSTQLAEALKTGTNIIITTLQKFPFVLDKVKDMQKRNYAVIVDEAHSSQGGESAKKMKDVLSDVTSELKAAEDKPDEFDDIEEDSQDCVRESMLRRGPQKNMSFFAFTATPKPKTLEVFGKKDIEGKPQPFHLYSMRQAIEEGFIHDVLKNYTTYKTFYRITKKAEEDPTVNKKKAAIAIARFTSLHVYNLAQKTEVIVEHFRQKVMGLIGGKAKAMVVTASREHVVRYKQAFDNYIKEKGYTDIKALVAFSGTVLLDGVPPEYTESKMNGFGEKELPAKFNGSEYQILLVAEKYQTGFDQPLLHTMYVDKRLDGVRAVQTLSRLNRTCPGKDDTFVLDFVNERDDILNAFQPYYEQTQLEEVTDPNKLYDLKVKLDTFLVTRDEEIEGFCTVFFAKKQSPNKTEHAKLNSLIDSAVERFKKIEKEEDREDYANTLGVFVRLYAFLAQIMPFSDIVLEKYYAYSRFLLRKLPKKNANDRYRLNDEVALEYYRLKKIGEGNIVLQKDSDSKLKPISGAGTKEDKEEMARLSEIIKILNDRFGTDLTEADKLFFDSIEEEMMQDDKLGIQAKNNPIENFKFGFEDIFMNKVIERMDQNQDIFNKIMDDKQFAEVLKAYMLRRVYERFNKAETDDSAL